VADETVLLVMDVQRGVVDRYVSAPEYLARVSGAVAAARDAGIPVVYVTVSFRPGHPEISARNKTFAPAVSAGRLVAGSPDVEVHPAVAPRRADPVVTKRRVSAFAGSDLEVLLRSLGAGTLVLSGIATSGVVLSTVRQAADMDYRVVVLADGCLDGDAEVHRVLTEKVFPRQADVRTVAEWTAEISSHPTAGSVSRSGGGRRS
jgi:nicotinamidase-related amidase